MVIWRRSNFQLSRYLSSQDLRHYSTFAPLTLLPIIVSLVILPATIRTLGISTWQSIITGQGIGLILAEVVDGGWVTLGPKIFKDNAKISVAYRMSLEERFPRLVFCSFFGLFLICITNLDNKLIVSLSFLAWITSGFNVHWISIATGIANFSRNYVVLPRIIGQVLGMCILILCKSSFLYLLIQLLFSIAPLIASGLVLCKQREEMPYGLKLPKGRTSIVLGNLSKSSTIWILIIVGCALFDSKFAGFSAVFRFLDILTALSLIINQSNHSRHVALDGSKESRKRFLHSISFSTAIFLVSISTWPLIENLFFANQTSVALFSVFAILASIPFKTILALYTQDYLIVVGRTKEVLIINALQPIILVFLMWIVNRLNLPLGFVSYSFIAVLLTLMIVLYLVDSRFRVFLSSLLRKENKFD
jgi:hypothetical protein